MAMDDKTMLAIARENQALARALGDRQDDDWTITGKLTTKIVNALLNSGNTLEQVVRDRRKEKESGTEPGTPAGPSPAPPA